MAEYLTFNQGVAGSSPAGGTLIFIPKEENWFYCELCQTLAYHHDCCGNISCSGGGCEVCCQGPKGNEGPNGVIQKMINDGTAPSIDEVPHREDGMTKLLREIENERSGEISTEQNDS